MCETRVGSAAQIDSFIDQFIASLDQRLQAYKLLHGPGWSVWLLWLRVNIIP